MPVDLLTSSSLPDLSDEPAEIAPPSERVLLDALGDGVYCVDLQGCCTFVNRAALAVLGYASQDALLGRNMHTLIHHTRPDGSAYPVEACPLLNTLKTGRAVRLDSELLWRGDGSSFYAEYSSFPIMVDGAPAGSIITFAELSVRQDSRRRHALQHAISQVLESSDDTGAVQTSLISAIGTGFDWDAGALWLVGEAVRGLRCASSWRRGEAVGGALAIDETTVIAPGEGVAGRAWTERMAVAVHGAGGEIAFPISAGGRVIGAFHFVSRHDIELDPELSDELATLGRQVGQFLVRRKTEAALRDSETLKAAIMETALDCVVVVDDATRIREFNPAAEATFGWDRDEARGSELGALILPADFLVGHLRKFAAFLDDGEVSAVNRRVEAEAVRAGGERFPVEISVTPLKSGEQALFATTMRDITQRKRDERELAEARDSAEEANTAKSHFIASMSHELRTPLSAIIGYAEMLQEEMADSDGVADYAADMGKIESNARHLLGLINDVLDLSKIESGKMEVFAETFDVASLIGDIAATITTLIEKKGNRLDVRLAEPIGSAHTDLVKVKQIILNLLSNAAKFTENGTITLSAERRASTDGPDQLILAVSDDGIGMTPEQLDKLFQAFVQADSSTSRRFGGTGLGLSISRHFTDMLGGTIEVGSEFGRGSRFTVVLPTAMPTEELAIEKPAVDEGDDDSA